MRELLAFLLPPATALAGTRINHWLLPQSKSGFGLRFGLGLATGMLIFSQALLLAAIVGLNASGFFAWSILLWAIVELALQLSRLQTCMRPGFFRPVHLWFLLLAPVACAAWAIGLQSILQGAQEFDANAFWLLKARMLYFDHGRALFAAMHSPNLAYAHIDYPMLMPALYSLSYGAIGGADEHIVKTWPFWMLLALCAVILSLAQAWRQPRPAPILLVVFLYFLPATLQFVQQEGATLPLFFAASLAAILLVTGLAQRDQTTVGLGILALALCATVKFEGIIYAALWAVIIILFSWQQRWLKSPTLWKAILVSAISLFPYFLYRLEKPILHPASNWIHDGLAAPAAVLHRLPQVLFLNIGYRLFDPGFFRWTPTETNQLQFTGHWQGFNSFFGPDLALLPWIMLLLAAVCFWKRPPHRPILAALFLVTFGELVFLALVITCMPTIHRDLAVANEFACDIVGRYYYPFFAACFLGITTLWFLEESNTDQPAK